ncbi:MAG: hypothetical protein ACK4JY_08975 [Brevundimonas sp.]|uniref:hypothetical protein n=1 Tax=Brevundimonas sp. TaxID=1871086 RepID=UPI00391B1B05
MSTFKIAHRPDDQRIEIAVDLNALREVGHVGVRRASCFLGLGLRTTLEGPPDSVTLGETFTYQFMPDPLPDEIRESVASEYEAWIVGSALKELDQYLSLFLDDAWDVIQIMDRHEQAVDMSEVLFDQKFRMATNAGKKLARVAEAIGADLDASPHRSLSLARNALTHTRGVVCVQHTNEDETLRVHWFAPQTYIKEGNEERPFAGLVRVEQPDGAQVMMRIEERSERFKLGAKVRLTAHQLSEICFFYHQQIEVIVVRLADFLRQRGLTV